MSELCCRVHQDDFALEVKHYCAPRWLNPDSPISSTFELLNLVKEENVTRDGPTVVHDECVLHSLNIRGRFCKPMFHSHD